MRYSQNLVWKAVYEFVPSFEVANQSRQVINLPTALNTAAIKALLDSNGNGFASLGMDKGYAAHIIRDAIKELHEDGQFTFGSVEEYWS